MATKADAAERHGTDSESVLERSTDNASHIAARTRTSAADDPTEVGVKSAPAAMAHLLSSIARVLATVRASSTKSLVLGIVFAAGAGRWACSCRGGARLSKEPRQDHFPARGWVRQEASGHTLGAMPIEIEVHRHSGQQQCP